MSMREAGVGGVSMHRKVAEMSLDPALVWRSCLTLSKETPSPVLCHEEQDTSKQVSARKKLTQEQINQ